MNILLNFELLISKKVWRGGASRFSSRHFQKPDFNYGVNLYFVTLVILFFLVRAFVLLPIRSVLITSFWLFVYYWARI